MISVDAPIVEGGGRYCRLNPAAESNSYMVPVLLIAYGFLVFCFNGIVSRESCVNCDLWCILIVYA
jgi:hypothetical protein